ncbi:MULTISPECIES: hypothetical protein [unclassified Methanoregula]|uniref:hypothetical protein n=1 Tax=unclassified Methanoregula TaxID=2649730 RepID=UPI0009C78887|nr:MULTISPECIES: hypothetical protein [unclassified Methanoregula]OPX62815.1 MAG: hypothetical protein A4E33_01944 [Methanoregula sp. PtaB.Bin085]OPY35252.1 MAG: hypothetical protein A4E34_00780 [Methanoregula sp. PtaU1.Bin006]
MTVKYSYLVYSLAIILVVAAAGCLRPPSDDNLIPATVATPRTPIPEDITCSIFSKTAAYAYNGTSFAFTQKNPPMFINYTVVPKNVTVNRVFTDPNTKQTKTLTYSDYSQTSWFEVTVTNKANGEVILKDGFGAGKGYPAYLSRTLKVLKNGDFDLTFNGNDITATVNVWVKPHGNVEESRVMEFTNCAYMEGQRDTLATAKTTTIEGIILTWTPENQETK